MLQGAYLPKRRGKPSSEALAGSSGGRKVKTEKTGRDTVVGALGLQLKMRPTRTGYRVD